MSGRFCFSVLRLVFMQYFSSDNTANINAVAITKLVYLSSITKNLFYVFYIRLESYKN